LTSRAATALALSCVLAGCAHYPTNTAFTRVDSDAGYRIRATANDADLAALEPATDSRQAVAGAPLTAR